MVNFLKERMSLHTIASSGFWILMMVPLLFIQILEYHSNKMFLYFTICIIVILWLADYKILISKNVNGDKSVILTEKLLNKIIFILIFMLLSTFILLGFINLFLNKDKISSLELIVYLSYLISIVVFTFCLLFGIFSGRLDITLDNRSQQTEHKNN
jgi:uncharacterized membrane protein